MIQIRFFHKEHDYDTFASFWQAHGWQPVPVDALPALGIVAFDNETGQICSGLWCYLDNSVAVAVMEWVVTNPQNTPRQSLLAINHTIIYLKELLRNGLPDDTGKRFFYRHILTGTNVSSLIKLYQKQGFKKTDENVVNLILTLED